MSRAEIMDNGEIRHQQNIEGPEMETVDITGNASDHMGYSKWKKLPCHFTWDLEIQPLTDSERIIRNIDHDLEETPNLLRIEGLLFRAYLWVKMLDNKKQFDVSKAKESLDEADQLIKKEGEQLRNAYQSVSLLNRMWIEERSQDTSKVKALLAKLNSIKLTDNDHCIIGAVQATALSRLGPRVADTSLDLFEEAHLKFPENPGFLFGAALMAGRAMRFQAKPGSRYQDLDTNGQKLMDKEKKYCEAMMNVNPYDEYQLARSYLGLNLSRRGFTVEGKLLLEKAYEKAPQVQEVRRNLARYYRRNGNVNGAISVLEESIKQSPMCAESHFQLALCFKANKFYERALEELHKCLELNQGHNYAMLAKSDILEVLGRYTDAQNTYETTLHKAKHLSTEDKIILYHGFAKFLTKTKSENRHRKMTMWNKVVKCAELLEYQDEQSGEWRVREKAILPKKEAIKYLWLHHIFNQNRDLFHGIISFHNFEFRKAEKLLSGLDCTTDYLIPWYLAKTYLKWGLEKQVKAQLKMCQQEEATECFRKARENVVLATDQGLQKTKSRQLRADIALAMARHQLQCCLRGDSHQQQEQQTPATISLEPDCIKSYREAVRCGSLVASLELLRLIQRNHIRVISRWMFIEMLAEINVSCTQRRQDFVHSRQAASYFQDALTRRKTYDLSAICKKIKQDTSILCQHDFFGHAWKELYDMETLLVRKRFQNREGELEMDGRDEDLPDALDDVALPAVECCEKHRRLLDYVIVEFKKEELDKASEKKVYFPLILDETNAEEVERSLRKTLLSTFGIDMEKHYPELYKQVLQIQPCYNSNNGDLKTMCTLVNKCKHVRLNASFVRNVVDNPVGLARQCTDKVEEICNSFFDAMKNARDLRTKGKQLEDDIRRGEHKKAEELLEVLSSNPDFVVRIGSTWKLLEMMALIRHSRRLSSSRDLEADELESRLTNGKCALTQKLRRCHQAVEDALLQTGPQSNDVRAKCRETCIEVVELLNSVLAEHKNECGAAANLKPNSPKVSRRAQKVTEERPIAFLFLDMCPDDESRQQNESGHWTGIVKKRLGKSLSKMGVDKKLVDIILKAQPCVSEENYNFIAMETFLQGGGDDTTVVITTNNDEQKPFEVLELTRWCTDNAERLALEMAAIIPLMVHG